MVVLGSGGYWLLRPKKAPPALAEAGYVKSAVTQEGDSLQVIVQWELSFPLEAERAESLRVEVHIDSMGATATRVRVQPGARREDTVYVPAPEPGTNAEGLSCVAARHRQKISRETCTAWRYVRPMANKPKQDGVSPNEPVRIVIQPSGMQVDPDIGGRCATWQRRHPGQSVWIEMNRLAVPECTGPNNRPTVAQFCAFAELGDGRWVKTSNSANIPYCDELFRIRERGRLS